MTTPEILVEKEPKKQEKLGEGATKEKEPEKENQPYIPTPPYKPLIPYPQRLKQTKLDNQYKKLIQLIEKIHIEIHFIEAITQIPSYTKSLKDILTNKRKLDDPKPVERKAISDNKLAKKENEPGSFSILFVLGTHVIDKALIDLRASVSLMPLVVCKRINQGEPQPTRISLQLANRSMKFPIGILMDVPVKIGKIFIPTDFVVIDMMEDEEILILLGRPFLSTAGAIIDVKRGKMTFEVENEKVEFILSKFLQAPTMNDSCCSIGIIDECIREFEKPTEIMKLPSN